MFEKLYFKELASTNSYLKENFHIHDDLTVVYCSKQTNGHGRFGRKWDSEDGKSLTMSILLKPDNNVNEFSKLSLLTSVAVFQTLIQYSDNVTIKWPNDLLINGKKVCGVLLESIYSKKLEALIIGIGLNVNNKGFHTTIKNKATSLYIETKTEYSLNKLIDNILEWFLYYYKKFQNNDHDYLDICRNNSSVINQTVMLNTRRVYIIDILDNGNILVQDGKEIKELSYGEITFNDMYN